MPASINKRGYSMRNVVYCDINFFARIPSCLYEFES